jgi:hypothetical protein
LLPPPLCYSKLGFNAFNLRSQDIGTPLHANDRQAEPAILDIFPAVAANLFATERFDTDAKLLNDRRMF